MYPTSTVAPNSPDLNPVDYIVRRILQEKVNKICITDLDELKQRLRTEWAKLDHAVTAAAIISNVVDNSTLVMRVLYTISCNISHMLLSTEFKSGKFRGLNCSGINSGVSFRNNSMVARAQ